MNEIFYFINISKKYTPLYKLLFTLRSPPSSVPLAFPSRGSVSKLYLTQAIVSYHLGLWKRCHPFIELVLVISCFKYKLINFQIWDILKFKMIISRLLRSLIHTPYFIQECFKIISKLMIEVKSRIVFLYIGVRFIL